MIRFKRRKNLIPYFNFFFRDRVFYGQKLKTYLQKPGETIFMPNMILHTVWNVSPTIAIGDNPLYESGLIELVSSSGNASPFLGDRAKSLAKGDAKKRISDVLEQVEEAIIAQKIVNYTKPEVWRYDDMY